MTDRRTWYLSVLVLLGLAVLPVLTQPYLPMQDYPQHLLHARILTSHDDPSTDFARYYSVHLIPGPYAAFFLLLGGLGKVTSFELAGKVAVALYFLLVALLSVALHRRRAHPTEAPWGALLLFPLAFSLEYYLGFVTYLWSVPLLFLALLAAGDVASRPASPRRLALAALAATAVLLAHPFTFLLWVGFAGLAALGRWRNPRELGRGLLFVAVAALPFGLWLVLASDLDPAPFVWSLTAAEIAAAIASRFTGLRWYGGIDVLPLVLWAVAAIVVLSQLRSEERRLERLRSPWFLGFLGSLGAAFVLPFAKGNYTFINLRMAPVAFFFLGLWVASLTFLGWRRVALVCVSAALVLVSLSKHARVAAEVAEVDPLFALIPPRARVLPLVFELASPELDPVIVNVHLHDTCYYNIRSGGYTPYLIEASVNPARVLPRVHAQAPGPGSYRASSFRWDKHGAWFDWILARGASPAVLGYLGTEADLVGRSGRWSLFARRDSRRREGVAP